MKLWPGAAVRLQGELNGSPVALQGLTWEQSMDAIKLRRCWPVGLMLDLAWWAEVAFGGVKVSRKARK